MRILNIFTGILHVFKRKPKKKSEKTVLKETEMLEEEFQLPVLNKRDFPITEELLRRQKSEKLAKEYGVSLEKQGEFI